MCGIAGILELDPGRKVELELLSRMTSRLAHRGPDADGFFRDGPLGLGHRRLSIIDLSGGGQPMANEDETVWIVFNGEIFNFPELKRELESQGHRFRTRSDTECIVHLYEEHGPACASRLVGQFAFAIWDSARRRLFLARDHVGIKPLFYHLGGDRLLFASEIKAILEDERVERTMDPAAFLDYLTYRYIPSPRTIFRGIEKLPAGHWLLWEAGRTKVERFWEPPVGGPPPASEDDCARELESLLKESVRSQLMSDVPLGAFLSGGIDSSIIVGLMAGLMDRPVKTFTIGFKEADFSEMAYARQVAEKYRTEHRQLIVEPESIDLLPRLVGQLDEPFADPSAIPTYYVCRMAREHVTVCLSGDGGDEGFAGYRRYQWALKHAKLDWLPPAIRRALFGSLARLLPPSRYRNAARRFGLDAPSRYADVFSYWGGEERNGLLSPELRRMAEEHDDFTLLRDLYRRAAPADYLTRLQYIDIQSYLPDDVLVKTDRMSMLNSLEVRVPLLDHRVLEYAASIPSGWRLGKKILRRAAGHLLPPALLERRKMGFGVPIKHWFQDDWKDYARDLLLGQRARERGFLETRAVEAFLEDHLGDNSQDRGNASASLYALLVFEEWCRQYLDQPHLQRAR